MAKRISERMPMARGGSKPNGASGKPVTLVKIVVSEEQGGPAAERLAGQQAVEHDQAGHDADQAQANMNSKQ